MKLKIPPQLIESMNNGKLVIFVGAGLSTGAGIPSWKKLVKNVLLDNENVIEKSSDYIKAIDAEILSPQEVLDKIKKYKKYIYKSIESSLQTDSKESGIHKKLTLIASKFVTTNFDNLIERHIDDARKITKNSEYNLSKIDQEESFVLKIHGDIEEIDKCIVFSDQYKELYADQSLASFELKKIFSQNSILFIGFSFSDFYVKELFEYVSKLQDGYGPDHFILTTDEKSIDGINSIKIKSYDNVEYALDNLISKKNKNNICKVVENDVLYFEKDGSDIPPNITNWAGREKELDILNKDFKVYFIIGIGGQGKSALASRYLNLQKQNGKSRIYDWRDFKEEDHKFQNKIISMILLVSDEKHNKKELLGLSDDDLVNVFFERLNSKSAIFVLDNIDQYIDLDEFVPKNGVGKLFQKALQYDHNSKFIFTCRPFIRFASLDFYQLNLDGLTKGDVFFIFESSNLNLSDNDMKVFAIRAYELTKGHALWINLIVAQAKRGRDILKKFLDSIENSNLTDDDISSILSENILSKIWKSLSEKNKILLRSLAESVRSETVDDYAEIVSDELNHNQFSKSLRALKNLNLIVEKTNGDYIELHPLVKEFIRKKYPSTERTKFISLYVKYYDKIVLILKPMLSYKLSFQDFSNWTTKVELFTNAKKYQDGINTLQEINAAMRAAGYTEEYLRVAKIFFSSLSWSRKQVREINGFTSSFSDTLSSAIDFGDLEFTEYLIERYETQIENKEVEYIRLCSLKAYNYWFQGDYDRAIKISEEADYLLQSGDQPDNYNVRHHLALALRDTKITKNIDAALDIFLNSEDIVFVSDDKTIDTDFSGSFYGNIGRCLQYKNDYSGSLNCLYKSHILNNKSNGGERLVNLGYASIWLFEVLKESGSIEPAYYFWKNAINLWDKSSPPLSNKYKKNISQKDLNTSINSILSLDEWQVEKYCNDWVNNKLKLKVGC